MVFAFFFVVVGVDTLFIVRAVGTFPDEQVKNSYVLGLDYNSEVARREAQKRLGWTAQAGLAPQDGGTVVVRISSADQKPVTDLDLSVHLHAFGQGGDGQDVRLSERAPGEYVAKARVAGAARIELEVKARKPGADDVVFEASKTVVIS